MTDLEDEWTLDGFMAEVDRVNQNPPPAPPGLELVECAATPRHWPTYVASVDGMYPATCSHCQWEQEREHVARLEHLAHHRRWQTWRISRWFARHAYSLGIIAGSCWSWPPCCGQRTTLTWRGRRPYILGMSGDEWHCLRRGHRHSPHTGCGLCTVCMPCSECGSTDRSHRDSIDCPPPPAAAARSAQRASER